MSAGLVLCDDRFPRRFLTSSCNETEPDDRCVCSCITTYKAYAFWHTRSRAEGLKWVGGDGTKEKTHGGIVSQVLHMFESMYSIYL